MEAEQVTVPPPSAGGDEASFTQWALPHWPAMTMLAARISPPNEADDVLQDALIAAWKLRFRYDAGRGTARSWLLALVVDHARRHRRQSARRGRFSATDSQEAVAVAGSERDEQLLAAVRSLPGRQRSAVELHYFLDLPLTEVAEAMGCRLGTVKSTLHSARKNLEHILTEEEAVT